MRIHLKSKRGFSLAGQRAIVLGLVFSLVFPSAVLAQPKEPKRGDAYDRMIDEVLEAKRTKRIGELAPLPAGATADTYPQFLVANDAAFYSMLVGGSAILTMYWSTIREARKVASGSRTALLRLRNILTDMRGDQVNIAIQYLPESALYEHMNPATREGAPVYEAYLKKIIQHAKLAERQKEGRPLTPAEQKVAAIEIDVAHDQGKTNPDISRDQVRRFKYEAVAEAANHEKLIATEAKIAMTVERARLRTAQLTQKALSTYIDIAGKKGAAYESYIKKIIVAEGLNTKNHPTSGQPYPPDLQQSVAEATAQNVESHPDGKNGITQEQAHALKTEVVLEQVRDGKITVDTLQAHVEKLASTPDSGVNAEAPKLIADAEAKGLKPESTEKLKEALKHYKDAHASKMNLSEAIHEYNAAREKLTRAMRQMQVGEARLVLQQLEAMSERGEIKLPAEHVAELKQLIESSDPDHWQKEVRQRGWNATRQQVIPALERMDAHKALALLDTVAAETPLPEVEAREVAHLRQKYTEAIFLEPAEREIPQLRKVVDQVRESGWDKSKVEVKAKLQAMEPGHSRYVTNQILAENTAGNLHLSPTELTDIHNFRAAESATTTAPDVALLAEKEAKAAKKLVGEMHRASDHVYRVTREATGGSGGIKVAVPQPAPEVVPGDRATTAAHGLAGSSTNFENIKATHAKMQAAEKDATNRKFVSKFGGSPKWLVLKGLATMGLLIALPALHTYFSYAAYREMKAAKEHRNRVIEFIDGQERAMRAMQRRLPVLTLRMLAEAWKEYQDKHKSALKVNFPMLPTDDTGTAKLEALKEDWSPEVQLMMTMILSSILEKPDWSMRLEMYQMIVGRIFDSVPALKTHTKRAEMVDGIAAITYRLMSGNDLQKRADALEEEMKKIPNPPAPLSIPNF